ncbi:Hypothetical_protein [Hexamita inflata]|uniref:Hypothetical_protein n=1 Tax=Hexamita inflata TaxID=28002 RepID=A0AA86NUT4_9EUKA|nr:Hypothetical protein HINF_LOCUS14607 [Hexamita inflata]
MLPIQLQPEILIFEIVEFRIVMFVYAVQPHTPLTQFEPKLMRLPPTIVFQTEHFCAYSAPNIDPMYSPELELKLTKVFKLITSTQRDDYIQIPNIPKQQKFVP